MWCDAKRGSPAISASSCTSSRSGVRCVPRIDTSVSRLAPVLATGLADGEKSCKESRLAAVGRRSHVPGLCSRQAGSDLPGNYGLETGAYKQEEPPLGGSSTFESACKPDSVRGLKAPR